MLSDFRLSTRSLQRDSRVSHSVAGGHVIGDPDVDTGAREALKRSWGMRCGQSWGSCAEDWSGWERTKAMWRVA
jgi:hypothetical protein